MLPRRRFTTLLLMLLLLLLALPFMESLPATRFALGVLTFGVMISAVYAVSDRRKHVIAAVTLALVATTLRILVSLFGESDLEAPPGAERPDTIWLWGVAVVVRLLLEMLYFPFIIVVIVRHVLKSHRVTFDMICASLCAYLLLGLVWANAYVLLESGREFSMKDELSPPFSPSLIPSHTELSFRERHDLTIMNAIYLSFVTLTTLGYGDFTPQWTAAKMLTVVQAIVGQFYLTVLVARLVGLHIAHPKDEPG